MALAGFRSLESSVTLVGVLLFTTPVAATAKEALATVLDSTTESGSPTELVDEVMGAFGLSGKWAWESALSMEIERHLEGLAGHNWRVKNDGNRIVVYGNPLVNPPHDGLRHEVALKFEDHPDHVTVKRWRHRGGKTVFAVNDYYGWKGSLYHLLRVERPLRQSRGRSVVYNERKHTSNPGWRSWTGKVTREIAAPTLWR